MRYTALHRVTGRTPGEVTADMLDDAITAGVREARDLDWKSKLPPSSGVADTDFPKDVAAMRNSGGGIIAYGVTEAAKAVTGRQDTGQITEGHERTLRAAAATAINPPIFDLRFDTLTFNDATRVVVLDVPPGVDAPHMIRRQDYFGAPIRNDADTVWMTEREIEAAYRSRFTERDNAAAALARLYDDLTDSIGTAENARLVGVARPRIRPRHSPATRDEARAILTDACRMAASWTKSSGTNTLISDISDVGNPRPGLRRWVAHPHSGRVGQWDQAAAALHHDGSVTHWASAGGFRMANAQDAEGHQVHASRMEQFAAAMFALVRTSAARYGSSVYEIRIGIVWRGAGLQLVTVDNSGAHFPYFPDVPPLTHFAAVDVDVRSDLPEDAYLDELRDYATDLVNQGGVEGLHAL